ncbi:hypothetical protein [Marinobacter sp. ANT_B65]|uniref:hypothetical protein n=1 Tax=Marinobacter sp. ANT_B65 TaxID=2039467 RepID=UPI000BBE6429|nr:hypothetical protein [Marinobacter sp. ANT_B65]PCM45805.1 hypothetical protein CPA50_07495 [Marinobacter sp. ANT_B65]
MSNYYTFTLNLKLKRNLTYTDITVLEYILNGEGAPPTDLPDHNFFDNGLPKHVYWKSYKDFSVGSWRSEFWKSVYSPGCIADGEMNYGVNIHLPSTKMEGALSELPFACWLATISASIGYVGAITCEDDGVGMPLLLMFVSDGQLKISSLPGNLEMDSAEGISG